jgi:replication-associated recombination protein RarA|tara:strand:+ start:737 stop:1645 length:909 start_codon:yes stop_codon:yes gene_type:complete
MSWYHIYRPKTLDEISSNKNVVSYLKNMIKLNKFSHFVLSGDASSGKRTLIKIFLNTVTPNENTLWLNHLSLKTIDSKEKLNSFINSKTNSAHKWLIIENLHKMSSQFLYVLYNILSSTSIVVCVLESTHHIDLSSWAITFDMKTPSESNLQDIAKRILKKENHRYNKKLVNKCIEYSEGKLCTFLFFLQVKYQKNTDIMAFSHLPFSYEKILYHEQLKTRISELFRLESVGYSHMDIARQLFKHVCCDSSKIDYSIILGDAIEHLNHFEHDPYYLYASICKIWKIDKKLKQNCSKTECMDC